jgi:hypothetical protein
VAADPNAVPPILAQLAVPPTRAEIFIWEQDFKRMGDKIHQYEENCERAYALVWGQCSPELRNKLKSAPHYVSGTQDVVQLLILIRGFCCTFDDQRQGTWSLQQAKKKAFLYVQKPGMVNADYMEEFMVIIGVVETYGGEWGQEPGLIRAKLEKAWVPDIDNPTDAELDEAKEAARDDFLAMMFLSGADKERYWKLRDELSNDYAKGADNYPSTLDGMLRLLNNYKTTGKAPTAPNPKPDGLTFLQEGRDNKGCWHCGDPKHRKADCPKLKSLEEGTDNPNINEEGGEPPEQGIDNFNIHREGVDLLQGGNRRRGPSILRPNHLYVDTCASYASTPYPELLISIEKRGNGLVGHSNAGSTVMGESGSLEGLKNVWVNESGIANIIPFSELIKMCRVTFDSEAGNQFVVHTKDGAVPLQNNEVGMPYIDISTRPTSGLLYVFCRRFTSALKGSRAERSTTPRPPGRSAGYDRRTSGQGIQAYGTY